MATVSDLKKYCEVIEAAALLKMELSQLRGENETLKAELAHLKLIIARFQIGGNNGS